MSSQHVSIGEDHAAMKRCLDLALKGRGKTGTNPMVGAVLVREKKIIAEGFHAAFGKAHAERQLLENIEQKISSNDTLYVNLEPCCHTEKKTPPCAQMIIERGVKNVVIGMLDPNPAVSGKGVELLRAQGIGVRVAMGQTADCLRLNRGYVSLQTKGYPWITLKEAMTLDGHHAKRNGSPLKITSAEQDAWAHRFLRARHDAILVGIGTVLSDDPQLTARYSGHDEPYRIVLDATLKIPLTARIVNSVLATRTIIITTPDSDPKKASELRKRGVTIFEAPLASRNFDWSALWQKLTVPTGDFSGISSILVEGGEKTWDIFRSAGLCNEEVILLGDLQA